MSDTKRQELIDSGQLHPDGSRIERCPTCQKELTAEEAEAIRGSAHGEAEAASVGVESPDPTEEA